jgi:hypothetical protein
MKLSIALVLAAAALSSGLTGCAYGSIATTGDKVVITREDSFLFGALRKVFVCKVTDAGVANCNSAENP